MKRFVALLCVVVLVCSFATNTIVYAEEYVDLDENYYDKESYHNEIRKRYKEVWGHLSSVAFTEEYYSFVNLLNETHDDAFLEFGTNLAGEKLDKKKYIEILTNIMGLMELNAEEMISKQVQIDTLKTFGDYALDATEILVEGISVSAAFGTGVTASMKAIASTMDLTWDAAEVMITSSAVYQYLDRSLKNYNQYYDFLGALTHSSNNELRSAAEILSEVVDKAFYCKMDAVITDADAAAKFIGKDVFFDTVLLEGMLSDASILELSKDEMDAIGVFKKTYDFLGVIEFSLDAGIFISDIVSGFSDCMNRYTEMHALYEIRKALIDKVNVGGNWESYIDRLEPKDIARNCTLLRQLQLVNFRGEYCFYQMMMTDGDLLSFIFTLNGQDVGYTEHFERQKKIIEDYMKVVDIVIPPSENYKLDIPASSENSRGQTDTYASTFSSGDRFIPYGNVMYSIDEDGVFCFIDGSKKAVYSGSVDIEKGFCLDGNDVYFAASDNNVMHYDLNRNSVAILFTMDGLLKIVGADSQQLYLGMANTIAGGDSWGVDLVTSTFNGDIINTIETAVNAKMINGYLTYSDYRSDLSTTNLTCISPEGKTVVKNVPICTNDVSAIRGDLYYLDATNWNTNSTLNLTRIRGDSISVIKTFTCKDSSLDNSMIIARNMVTPMLRGNDGYYSLTTGELVFNRGDCAFAFYDQVSDKYYAIDSSEKHILEMGENGVPMQICSTADDYEIYSIIAHNGYAYLLKGWFQGKTDCFKLGG